MLVVALDQWTKYLVQQHLSLNMSSRSLIPGVLNLTYVQNDGVAFGQLRGAGALHLVIAFLAIAAMVYFFIRAGREDRVVPLMLTLGLAFIPALVNADRRAIHDRLAHTRVVALPSA